MEELTERNKLNQIIETTQKQLDDIFQGTEFRPHVYMTRKGEEGKYCFAYLLPLKTHFTTRMVQ